MRYSYLLIVTLGIAARLHADQFVTGQPADVVLGQANFTTGTSGSAPNRFSAPTGVAYDPATGKVFVSDSSKSRILRFSSLQAATNGGAPEAVFGQPNFTSTLANLGMVDPTAQTLDNPGQIALDHLGRLWVADYGNHRVVGYYAASYANSYASADFVFGQDSFTTDNIQTDADSFQNPLGVWVGEDDTLWVADSFNHRVLKFSSVSSKANGADADGVLGKGNFVSSTPGTSSTNMSVPSALSTDSAGRLWVAEALNHRVLRFDDAATLADANGASASGVLGQALFTTNTATTSATGMNNPYGILAAPDGTVWVGELGNNRLVAFRNAASKPNGGSGDLVIGQTSFTASSFGTTDAKFSNPKNLCHGPGGSLYVADTSNNRVLRFSQVKSPTVTIQTRNSSTTASTKRVRGKAAGQVSSVTYRVGKSGAFRKASGTAGWSFNARLKPGKNVITVVAEGPGGSSAPKKVTITRE